MRAPYVEAQDPERLTLSVRRVLLARSRSKKNFYGPQKANAATLFCLENSRGAAGSFLMLAQVPFTSASPVRHLSAIGSAAGFFSTVRAIREAARLTSTQRLVLFLIASHADNATGEASVGMPRLAAESGLTTRTIERTIAALVGAGWLTRASAASQWGTNLYRVTPRSDDARPSPRRAQYGRPFAPAPAPDTRSGGPPSREQKTPDTRSGILRSQTPLRAAAAEPVAAETLAAGEPAEHTQEILEVRAPAEPVAEHEAPVAETLAALAAHPELAPIARRPVAALVAAEKRPSHIVRRALGELAAAVAIAGAAGERWSAATLARKARAYVRLAWDEPNASPIKAFQVAAISKIGQCSHPVAEPEPVAEPGRLSAAAGNLRALLANLNRQL